MGNEVSQAQGLGGGLPPLVVQVEALLWPGVAGVSCEIFLDTDDEVAKAQAEENSPDEQVQKDPPSSQFVGEASSLALPSKPLLVERIAVTSRLRVHVYDVQSGDAAGSSMLTSLVLPISRLVLFGLPLYTSLWLGLGQGGEEVRSFEMALERAKAPDAPKLRLSVFKPCPRSLTMLTMGGEAPPGPSEFQANGDAANGFEGGSFWKDFPKPDIYGAFQEEMDQGAGCSGRDDGTGVPGLTLPRQVMRLIECLRTSNDTVSNLQAALFQRQAGGEAFLPVPPTSQILSPSLSATAQSLRSSHRTVKLRVSITEASGLGLKETCCICEAANPSATFIQKRGTGAETLEGDVGPDRSRFLTGSDYAECPNFPVGEPLRLTVRPMDPSNFDTVLAQCSMEFSEFCPQGFSGRVSLLDDQRSPQGTVMVTIFIAPEAEPPADVRWDIEQAYQEARELFQQLETERAARTMAEEAASKAMEALATERAAAVAVVEKSGASRETAPKVVMLPFNESICQFECEEMPVELQQTLSTDEFYAVCEVINADILGAFGKKWCGSDWQSRTTTKADSLRQHLPTFNPAQLCAGNSEESRAFDSGEIQGAVSMFLDWLTESMPYLTWQLKVDGQRMSVAVQQKNPQLVIAYLKQELAATRSQSQSREEALQAALGEATPRQMALVEELALKDKALLEANASQAEVLELQKQISIVQGERDASVLQGAQREGESREELRDACNDIAKKDQELQAALQREAALQEALEAAERACAFGEEAAWKASVSAGEVSQQETAQREAILEAALRDSEGREEDAKKACVALEENFQAELCKAQGSYEADLTKVHVSHDVQQAKLRSEIKVLNEVDEKNKELTERVARVEAELAEARLQVSATAPSVPLRSLPDISQLQQQAELDANWKAAAEARQKEIDALKLRLEQESFSSQRELAIQQREEFADLERRQDDTLALMQNSHQDSLRRLQDKIATTLKMHEAMAFEDAKESLQSILSECVQGMRSLPPAEEPEAALPLTAPPTQLDIEVKQEVPPSLVATGIDPDGTDENRDIRPGAPEAPAMTPPGQAEDRGQARQGTVRCNRCSALNMINLEGPPTVQCGSCSYEFTALWDDMMQSRVSTGPLGGLPQVAEESPADTSNELCDGSDGDASRGASPSPLITEVSPRITDMSPRSGP